MPLNVSGLNGQKCSFDAARTWRVEQLKVAIYRRLGILAAEQRLIIGTRELAPGEIIEVGESSNVDVTLLHLGWKDAAGNLVLQKSTAVVRKLFEDGAYDPQMQNHLGQTLAFYAVQNKSCSAEMTSMLVEQYGVQLGHADHDGQTAAHFLAKTGNIECLRYFADSGQDLNHVDKNGQTPVFFAASKGDPPMIQALFSLGADVTVKDLGGRTPLFWARNEENWQALAICSFRVDHDLLAWTTSRAGYALAVAVATEADVVRLASLEQEFLSDHQKLLEEVLPKATQKDICRVVGLNPSPQERRQIIRRIATTSSATAWTLKCFRIHGWGTSSKRASLVGYCYCYQKEKQAGFTISHLKVAREQQRSGCATLLLSGAITRMEMLAKRGLLPPQFGAQAAARRLELSVVEQNSPARALYAKLGFTAGGPPTGDPVRWVRMTKDCRATAGATLTHFLSLIPGKPGVAEPDEGGGAGAHGASAGISRSSSSQATAKGQSKGQSLDLRASPAHLNLPRAKAKGKGKAKAKAKAKAFGRASFSTRATRAIKAAQARSSSYAGSPPPAKKAKKTVM